MADTADARSETAQEGTPAPALVHVEPHRWALSWWARLYRRAARRWTVTRHVRSFCRPLTVEGAENLKAIDNPLLVIANHTSHFDTAIVLSLLPMRIYNRTAIAAAADRMYRERLKGMLNSLQYNSFPITRGGDARPPPTRSGSCITAGRSSSSRRVSARARGRCSRSMRAHPCLL